MTLNRYFPLHNHLLDLQYAIHHQEKMPFFMPLHHNQTPFAFDSETLEHTHTFEPSSLPTIDPVTQHLLTEGAALYSEHIAPKLTKELVSNCVANALVSVTLSVTFHPESFASKVALAGTIKMTTMMTSSWVAKIVEPIAETAINNASHLKSMFDSVFDNYSPIQNEKNTLIFHSFDLKQPISLENNPIQENTLPNTINNTNIDSTPIRMDEVISSSSTMIPALSLEAKTADTPHTIALNDVLDVPVTPTALINSPCAMDSLPLLVTQTDTPFA